MRRRINFFIFMMLMLLFFPKLHAQQDMLFLDEEKVIFMDFKDAELKDVLKIFSIQSGMNFIASEAVNDRTITLYLNNVPVREAMDKLFQANNLSYELDKRANIIIVKDWGKPDIETVCKVFYLKYAMVSVSSLKEEMSQQLTKSIPLGESMDKQGGSGTGGGGKNGKWKQEESAGITEAVKKLLSEYGSLIEDFHTNSLIVMDIPSRMPIIAQVIAALDVRLPQIMLEVEMLDVSKNVVDKMGVKFPESLATLDMTSTGWTLSNWSNSNFGDASFALISTKLAFDFLRTQTDTKYLARPRILTLNNEPAEIRITTNEAIGIKSSSSGEGAGAITTEEAERVMTGIVLRVIPQLNPDTGEITMFLYPQVSEAITGSLGFKDPETRSTKCVLRAKDGETIVVGGLIRNDYNEIRTKVPILGDIPLLGGIFRHKNKGRDRERELLVFITPRIIKDSAMDLARMSKARLPEREQETASGINRQEAISSSLNTFEKTSY